MSDISFLVAQRHRSDKTLHLDRFASEAFTDKSRLGHHAFPRLAFALSSFHHLEHLIFCYPTDFWKRNSILGSFVLPFLFDRRRQSLGIFLSFTIKKICG